MISINIFRTLEICITTNLKPSKKTRNSISNKSNRSLNLTRKRKQKSALMKPKSLKLIGPKNTMNLMVSIKFKNLIK